MNRRQVLRSMAAGPLVGLAAGRRGAEVLGAASLDEPYFHAYAGPKGPLIRWEGIPIARVTADGVLLETRKAPPPWGGFRSSGFVNGRWIDFLWHEYRSISIASYEDDAHVLFGAAHDPRGPAWPSKLGIDWRDESYVCVSCEHQGCVRGLRERDTKEECLVKCGECGQWQTLGGRIVDEPQDAPA